MKSHRIVWPAAAAIVVILGCAGVPTKFEAHTPADLRRHIEQQVASILDYIEGKSSTLPVPASEVVPRAVPKAASGLDETRNAASQVSAASAPESKPAMEEFVRVMQTLEERHPRLQALKAKSIAGEDNRGYLSVRPKTDSPLTAEERNEAQRLIAAENKDRKSLYQEVARMNKMRAVSVADVERVFAAERLRRAIPGEMVQFPAKGPAFNAVKTSDLGKRQGDACQADAWVALK